MSRTRRERVFHELLVRSGAGLWLVVVWLLLWGEATPLILCSGVLVAVAVILFLPLPRVPAGARIHLGPALVLFLIISRDLVRSSLQLAWYAVRPAAVPASQIHWVRLRLNSDLVLTLAVLAINLVPGTVVLSIDRARHRIQVHLIPSQTEADVARFKEQVAQLEYWFALAFEQDRGTAPSARRRKDPR